MLCFELDPNRPFHQSTLNASPPAVSTVFPVTLDLRSDDMSARESLNNPIVLAHRQTIILALWLPNLCIRTDVVSDAFIKVIWDVTNPPGWSSLSFHPITTDDRCVSYGDRFQSRAIRLKNIELTTSNARSRAKFRAVS